MSAAQPLAGKRLIVVEDNPVVKMGVEEVLREAGASIVRSFDRKADAAILDLRLGTGITAVPIALTLTLRMVPFLFYTAQTEEAVAPLRNRWPGCKIIQKPADGEAIVAAVVDLLKNPRMGVPRLAEPAVSLTEPVGG
jgi:DNA-binding response OmpR family regulator